MSTSLVLVLTVAAAVPLLSGALPRLRLPGALAELVAGIVLGPSILGVIAPDDSIRVLALLGLSILLFLAGYEVDPRRFRGQFGVTVLSSLAVSIVLAVLVAAALTLAGVDGAVIIGVGLLATSLGLIVPVLNDAGALDRPVGRFAVAGASAGEIAAVVVLSVGFAGSDTPLTGRLLLLGLLLIGLAAIAAVILGAEHSMRLTAIVRRGADTSAQIRIRLTVLLIAGLALAAERLGFEAILGAFLAGVLVRGLDPDPQRSHPLYPVKLEAIGFGLLVPVFFVTSGLTLDLSGLVDNAGALALVPVFLVSLLLVRGAPALVFRRDLSRTEIGAVGLLQATSLPFLLSVSAIGVEMGTIEPATAAALVAAGLLSVTIFPVLALVLLAGTDASVSVRRQ